MQIIYFHNHFYPLEYIEAVKTGPSAINVTFDDQENPLLHYPGDYNIVVPGHRDISFREKVLEKAGIDKQILTFTSPGTHIETPERAVEFGKRINDIFADIIGKHSEKFLRPCDPAVERSRGVGARTGQGSE